MVRPDGSVFAEWAKAIEAGEPKRLQVITNSHDLLREEIFYV